MKRSVVSVTSRVPKGALCASLVAPLLATYLFLGSCGGGKHGFVVAFHGWGVSAAAAVCR